ncbi:MAG: hypothetical protein BWY50_00849 [Spirochaetes bacterium ADurb.Bin315]|jgi:hypothetical protein|nr:MAG: hypothetical protein BWY50_00849 [Spirochaetes bacterium ADurb.Bin315]TAH57462.1 MAG: hypothetical protein EWM48_05060 [Sphaerochaeta sp.]HOE88612.1 hypothetical protein [Sphaerochaeta sp.]HOR79781.1 hypothetical protein [Sphaerochaeta sp.]HPK63222.1 hypothetical protein [Sphaerochaeta sp.]
MTKKIEFKYIFEKDYNPKYVNGAFGGMSPTGEMVVNFYLERMPLPYSDFHDVKEGQVGDLTGREPEDYDSTIVRYIQNGIVLSLEHAKAIHNWLGLHIAEAERIEAQKKLPR